MNEKNIKALLKGLGLPDSTFADLEKDDFDAKKVISDFNEGQKAHYTDIVKNEISSQIESDTTARVEGRIYGTLESDLKKHYGLPTEVMEKIKGAKIHEKLKIAKDFLDEKRNGSESEVVKKLQEESLEWQKKHTELEGKLTGEIDRVNKEAKGKIASRLSDIRLQKALTGIPAEKIVGKKLTDGHSLAVKALLGTKYNFDLDDKDEVIPYELGTTKRATSKDTSGKESFVTIEDLVLNSMKELNFLVESNGGEGSGNGGAQGNGNGHQRQKSQHMIEMEAEIAKS